MDNRKPKLEKVGCFTMLGSSVGFTFFEGHKDVKDGELFIYNRGILWKVLR